jgi:hypothetical protein
MAAVVRQPAVIANKFAAVVSACLLRVPGVRPNRTDNAPHQAAAARYAPIGLLLEAQA